MDKKDWIIKLLYPLSAFGLVLSLLMVYNLAVAYESLGAGSLNFLGIAVGSPYAGLIVMVLSVISFFTAFILSGSRLYRASKAGWEKKIEEQEEEQMRHLEEQERLKNEEYARREKEKRISARAEAFMQKLQEAKNETTWEEKFIRHLCNELQAVQGIYYKAIEEKGIHYLEISGAYAYHKPETLNVRYEFGEGLCGQVAKEGIQVVVKDIPEGYIQVLSGLGATGTAFLLIAPLLHDGAVAAVVEVASFVKFDDETEDFIKRLSHLPGTQLRQS